MTPCQRESHLFRTRPDLWRLWKFMEAGERFKDEQQAAWSKLDREEREMIIDARDGK